MKKIILIGDSIRMGYDKYVKEALDGVAQVYYPAENCKFAQYVLRFTHDWKQKGEWPDDVDLIHWNAGLWDVLEPFVDGPLTPVEFYADTIARIDKRLRQLFPGAKMVFATSSAVMERGFTGNFYRKNAVIKAYNDAAVKALEGTDTIIDDLFGHTLNCPEKYHSDLTHFNNPEGAAFVGDKVLSVLCKTLDIPAADVNVESFELEKYTAENIAY